MVLRMTSLESAMEAGTRNEPEKLDPSPFNLAELNDVAEFLNRDPDLWVFRRFGKLHILNILAIQQRLILLEHKLQQQISHEEPREFITLHAEIQQALKDYGMLYNTWASSKISLSRPDPSLDAALWSQANSKSYKAPEDYVIEHMEDWAELGDTNGWPLRNMLHKSLRKDVAAIAGAEKTWTHKFIDRHPRLRRMFAENPFSVSKDSQKHWTTLIYSEEWVRQVEATLLHGTFCVLLLCPIIGLSYLHNQVWKWVLLAVSLLAASVLSIVFLNMPNKSGLAFISGYAAVLVVFMSNSIDS